jgi:bifunctional non-homologous end joining protein LigD
VKHDGYRVLIWRDGAQVRITSRGNQDWSAKLSAVAQSARRLSCRRCILDGELIAPDAAGHSSFARLQQHFGAGGARSPLRVMVFDLLFLDQQDQRAVPQLERKRRLEKLLRGDHAPLVLSSYALGNGPEAARAACGQGLEGIVSKLASAPYREGRSGAWLKIKCVGSDEYVILGYTAGRGAREQLGSLLLGSPEEGTRWRYRGRVGTGLGESRIQELLRRVRPARQPPRLVNPPNRAQLRGATPTWVHPELVVEIEYRGFTADGLLRQASLKGVRRDRGVDSLAPAGRDTAVITRDPA